MKIFVTFFAVATLSFSSSRLAAQDFAPPRLLSPAAEQTPAPTPAPTATATPSSTPAAKRAAPAKAVEPRRRTPSAPRRDVLRQEPVRAVEPRAPWFRRASASPRTSAPASRPTFDVSESSWVVAVSLRSLESRWEDAVKNHNTEALGELLSSNFEATSGGGNEASRKRTLSLLRRDKNVYRSARAHGMRVKTLGAGSAVVTGVSTESGVTADGMKFSVARDFTDTWKLRNGRWQCVASRVTAQRQR